ncbi:BPSL0067 family protein [Massilia sp. YIM B04103]|uniref:BPSL0067 family protein n=1 Tax=Massilia sp. YIM B04103 TaxID=2963106 RepID=UPI00210A610E|nr:BPSL0067 family protein [Massilia sp. YIM B04103]
MPYKYEDVDGLENHDMVGSHQCVALVQTYAAAPTTSNWRQGEAVVGNVMLRKGTAVATFVNGRYPNRSHGNHAAFFLRQALGGIYVMDQWKSKKNGKINSRFIRSQGRDKQGNFKFPSDNADAFFVIL